MTDKHTRDSTGPPPSGDIAVVERFLACVNGQDWSNAPVSGVERLTIALESLATGSPNLQVEVGWISSHGDRVSAWCQGTGTHTREWELPATTGVLAGRTVAPTGRSWRAPWSVTFQIRENRIVDVWGVWDWLSILGQLGVVTTAANAESDTPA